MERFFQSQDGTLYRNTPEVSPLAMRPIREDFARHHRTIASTRDMRSTLRAGQYAWPGGYQLFGIAADGECLCFDCIRKEYRQVSDAIRTAKRGCGDDWRIESISGAHETDSQVNCAHCGRELVEAWDADETGEPE